MPKFKKNTSPAMYKKPSSFKQKGFSGFGNEKYKNMIPKKTDSVAKLDTKSIKREAKALVAGVKGFGRGSASSISKGIYQAKAAYKRSKAKK